MDIFKSIIVWLIGISYMIVLFPLTFIVWMLVLPFDSERKIMHWMLICQGWFLCMIMPIWKIEIRGREKAARGTTYVIISNHQSILDILLINCLRYRYKWISKVENKKVPVLGWYLRMADYITVDRGNRESKDSMMERSAGYLEKDISIMLFPEGTRSPDGQIGFFKRGAFQLSISSQKPILPVIIDGTGGVLPKHGLIFSTGNRIKIRVLDPVEPSSFVTDNPDDLALWFCSFMKDELKKLREESID